MRGGAIVEEDDAVGEGFGGEELEADGAVARLNKGDAFADEDGDDVDAELVDFALVQKRGDDFAAAPFFFLVVRRQFRRSRDRSKEERDFSLRRPTLSQERKGKKKSACSVRNDGHRVGARRRWAKVLTGSLTNSKAGSGDSRGRREKT